MRYAVSLLLAAAALAAAGAGAAPQHGCIRGGELWFRGGDGTELVGHRFGGLRPGARTAVVLAHMSEGSLCDWLPHARRLAARGFFVFAFDFRGYGFSKGRRHFGRTPADYAAAVKAVRGLGARRVVLVGASLGGIAAVVAGASVRPPVDGVVAVSAPAAIPRRLDARPFAPRLEAPALFLVAEDDRSAGYDFAADARALHAAAGSEAKRLEVLPGSEHGIFLVERSARARALLEGFIRSPRG